MPELPSSPLSPQPKGTGSALRRSAESQKSPVRASLLSRRRLRVIFPVAAGVVLLVVFAAAAVFNTVVSRHNYAKDAVAKMQAAPNYSASGADTTTGPGVSNQVREQFSFIAPDTVRSRYVVSDSQGSSTSLFPSTSSVCKDQEVVILSGKRYARCNDAGISDAGWQTGNADASLFGTLQFKPWQRFEWCTNIRKKGAEEVNGEAAEIFTCQVPVQREADAYWPPDKLNDLPAKQKDARDKFLAQGTVDLTVWVRNTDGFIIRFLMKKVSPVAGGAVTETLDYSYGDFGLVTPILPPDQTTSALPIGGLPTSAPQRAVINGLPFRLEVADTEDERRIGLSNRSSLGEDAGMLFVFPQEGYWSFWMKNVLIPLDLLFMDSQGKIIAVYPMQTQPGVPDSQLTRYESPQAAKYALEINGGLAAALGLRPGMSVELP